MGIRIKVEDLGNNLWVVNGERIYAPNQATAVRRYVSKFDGGARVQGGRR